MGMVGIVATLKIVPGKEKDFEKLFAELRASTLKNEPGVLMYDFYKSRSEPNTYVVMEQYKSQADLDAHGDKILALLKRNLAQADSLGLQGTPTYLVGPFRTSTLDYKGFRQAVADARGKKTGP